MNLMVKKKDLIAIACYRRMRAQQSTDGFTRSHPAKAQPKLVGESHSHRQGILGWVERCCLKGDHEIH